MASSTHTELGKDISKKNCRPISLIKKEKFLRKY
jgi:hypothetical protein